MKSRNQRQLRQRCERALRGIEIPQPWDLGVFLDELGRRRGRPIILDEAPQLTNSISAYWWKDESADLIFYAPTESVFYRELNVFHEVGHMLCEHDREGGLGPMALGDVESLTTVRGAVQQMFTRDSRFTLVQEQEAEYVAYRLKLLVDQVSNCSRPAAQDPATEHMRATMRRTLGGAHG